MMKIVIDTNIVISAALSHLGNPAKIINLVRNNEDIQLYYNMVIWAEYKKVLSYVRLNLPKEEQEKALESIQETGIIINPVTSKIPLPDESDRIFYDTAKACNAYLITGNIKHYPTEPFILTPAQFVALFSENEHL